MSKQDSDTEETTCHKCGYQWNSDSEMERVTCPSCQRKTDRTEPEA